MTLRESGGRWNRPAGACGFGADAPVAGAAATIRGLLCGVIAVAETNLPEGYGSDLWPAEVESLGPHVQESRRREFAAGRSCARRALKLLGREESAIPVGPGRAPIWPVGVVGSITHTDGYCAAAIASHSCIRSIGIDAERAGPMGLGLQKLVCTKREREWLRVVRGDDTAVTTFFSAKESLYKAWYPLSGQWLDFLDVELTLEPQTGAFTPRPLIPENSKQLGFPLQFSGRYVLTGGLVLTTSVLYQLPSGGNTHDCQAMAPRRSHSPH